MKSKSLLNYMGALVFVTLIVMFALKLAPIVSEASELSIAGFETADLDTRKVSTYDVTVPETTSQDLVLSGSTGTEPATLSLDNGISTFSIIGSDGRERITNTKAVPFRYIAYIRTNWPNGDQTIGTAWLCGPSAMMTSAHCVYDSARGGYAKSIRVWPARNGSASPFDSYAVKSVHIAREWKTTGQQKYDFALMNLKTAIGNRLGYFGVRYKKGASAYDGKHIAIAGYPGEHQYQLWKMGGSVSESTASMLYYKVDTTGGQSGSPVYCRVPSEYYAIGIHGYGGTSQNAGVRITRKMFYWIKNKR